MKGLQLTGEGLHCDTGPSSTLLKRQISLTSTNSLVPACSDLNGRKICWEVLLRSMVPGLTGLLWWQYRIMPVTTVILFIPPASPNLIIKMEVQLSGLKNNRLFICL